MTETRRRYERLFGLLLNSGLRISEALNLKVAEARLVDGSAKRLSKSPSPTGRGAGERAVFQ